MRRRAMIAAIAIGLLVPVLLVLSLGVAPEKTMARPQHRPNIIFVMTNDQDESTLRHMPYVGGSFKASATTFPNATYNFSLCCPSRTSILRGQYTHNHKVWSNFPPHGGYDRFRALGLGRSIFPRWLHASGYQTGMFGLYLTGFNRRTDPKPRGWDKFVHYGYNYQGEAVGRTVHKDEVVKNTALRWLRESLPGGPLFMWVSFSAPHKPYDYNTIYRHRFTDAQLPKPPSFNEKDVLDKPSYVSNWTTLPDADVAQLTHDHRDRLRALLTPDDAVRRMVSTLSSAGELANTYIVFWSDNGYMMGQHRLLYKKHAYLESISFPMIVRGPNVPRGVTDPRIVMNQDLAPTFADIANARVPAFVDGRSMVPVFDGIGPWRDVGLIEAPAPRNPKHPPSYRGLRDEDYTYVQYATDEREYYDLRTDPYQLTNAYASLSDSRKTELSERTLALAGCAGATCRSLEEEVYDLSPQAFRLP